MKVYLVGGAVRDQLLGLPVKERDWVVVGANPAMMLEKGYRQVGKDFPVFIHPETGEEYALARTERKSGHGYYGFTVHAAPDVTLEADLQRRDLTINAMAQTESGEVIDPYGGKADLEKRQLRHISPAFTEDPVRILRVGRFAARLADFNFNIAEETAVLMRQMVREGEVAHLVPERVWQECERALKTDHPVVFWQALRHCGALAVLFPEIDRLFGVPNPPQWHPEIDSGVHTLMVLKAAVALTKHPATRFAALVHDLGKGLIPEEEWPHHHNHGELGLSAIKAVCKRYRVPHEFKELALLVSRYHIMAHRCRELSADKLLTFYEKLDAFRRPERFEAFLTTCEADMQGRKGNSTRTYEQKNYLLTLLRQLQRIDYQAIAAPLTDGAQIKQAIQAERLRLIYSVLDNV